MKHCRRSGRSGPVADDVSRRAAIRGAIGGGFAATLLATTGVRAVLAQATPPPSDEATAESMDGAAEGGCAAAQAAIGRLPGDPLPTRFELRGGETEIRYTPIGPDGASQLVYRGPFGSLAFTGDEIDLACSLLFGRLVTVTVAVVHDGYVKELTLLVPDINPVQDLSDVPIHTLAIVTTHHTNIGGPRLVQGALQTYEAVELEGTAEFAPPA